jgi:hypothetical protein
VAARSGGDGVDVEADDGADVEADVEADDGAGGDGQAATCAKPTASASGMAPARKRPITPRCVVDIVMATVCQRSGHADSADGSPWLPAGGSG